jgi:hypothetical protein
MGNLQEENEGSKMLGGDRSMKKFLEEAKEDREQSALKKEIFQENKSKIEIFYKTNIEIMLENRNKLADAKEKFRLRRLNSLNNKELIYEMDPFE